MADNSKELLEQLHDLEKGLSQFSFQSLTTEEAQRLKLEFNSFGHQLKGHLWGNDSSQHEKDQKPGQSWKLLAEVGHEIRTPLAGIVNMTDLLNESSISEEQSQWVVGIHKAAQSLLNLSSEILELSSIGANQSPRKNFEFNLPALINDQVFLCNTLLLDKDIKLNCSIDPQVPTYLTGDSSSLSQILLNILGNAIKYIEKGKIDFSVQVVEQKNDLCYLNFSVTDTGIGIADQELERIFDHYSRADHQREGKGLGLAIVKELVEQMGGCLGVESTIGIGTSFSVILPFGQEGQPLDKSKKMDLPKQKETVEQDRRLQDSRILVIEDDSLHQRWLEHRLKGAGALISLASSAEEASSILESKEFDLVLVDCKLPGQSGWQFIEKEQYRRLRFVLSSAQWSPEDQQFALQKGIEYTLEKPFSGDQMIEMLSRALKGQPSSAQTRLVDLQGLLTECQGSTQLLEELIQLFKQNILEFIGKTRVHLQSGNTQGVSFAAHKVKSSLRMIQAENLFCLCDDLDEGARGNAPLRALNALYHSFLDAYPATERAIEWELTQLRTNN